MIEKTKYTTNKKGFTLIELMVVVAVVALLVSMGVGGFNRSRQRQEVIRQGVFIENMFKDARNASVIGLRGLDTGEDVPPAYGIHIDRSVDDSHKIIYFTDRGKDYVFDGGTGDDKVVKTILLEDYVKITTVTQGEGGTDIDTTSPINILFVPPRGLSLISYGTDANFTIVDEIRIVIGANGITDVDDNLAIPLDITTGGGKVDLILY